MAEVKIELLDPKITQSEANTMMAPLELDLIAYYRVLLEDVLKTIETEKGEPEEIIELVLEYLNPEPEPSAPILKTEGSMPVPKAGESEKDFVSRCVPIVIDEGETQEQALGKCYGIYRNAQKTKVINELTKNVKSLTDKIKG